MVNKYLHRCANFSAVSQHYDLLSCTREQGCACQSLLMCNVKLIIHSVYFVMTPKHCSSAEREPA